MITPPAIPPRHPVQREKTGFKVAIIGAGLSGLSAAHHLVNNGVEDVVILEARHRIGGRIHTIKQGGNPLELGAQWIHGGCPANSVYNLANRFKLLGSEVQRLHEDTEDNDGDNLLKRWPTTKGYFYKPDGLPLSFSASNHAYEIFNSILDEADQYNKNQYQKHQHSLDRSGNAILQSTRLSTFYNGRKRKALESLRKTPEAKGKPP